MHDIREKYGELCFWKLRFVGDRLCEAAAQAAPVFSLREENAMRVAEQYKEVTKEFYRKLMVIKNGRKEEETRS